ncbi:TetR/AcrR family transcriptional regulator [Arenicella sp. 4NH20-0111]|uniref:TetR/AcrR family transcriptional regulator n=1 Tax=Arenicella sp. 4NH20-0111 TaxID=3127648 RepID=UPI0031061886
MNIRLSSKEAIIEAAFHLFKENPRASLAEIAKYAGVGRVTLHRHFSGREDLVIELGKIALTEMDEIAEQAASGASSYTDALRLMMFALVPLADRQWFLTNQIFDGSSDIQKESQRQLEEMKSVIDLAKKEGGLNSALPSPWICETFDALLYAAWEMVRTEQLTTLQASELAWGTFMNGVGSE